MNIGLQNNLVLIAVVFSSQSVQSFPISKLGKLKSTSKKNIEDIESSQSC